MWFYFLRDKSSTSAKCKGCCKIIKTLGGSTSGLHTHVKGVHNKNLLKRQVQTSQSSVNVAGCSTAALVVDNVDAVVDEKTDTSIRKYLSGYQDESFAAVISRLTAKDGLPFKIFCTSHDLRQMLTARGFDNIPKSANTIRSMVIKYAKKIRTSVSSELAAYVKNGGRLSITFDEWTSNKNRRYLNLNVHTGSNFVNLGLARVEGSLPAEKFIKLVEKKLNEHGLSIDRHIVCMSTDGASVMRKMGRLLPIEQQLCLAHGIQLAVIDVLYDKKSSLINRPLSPTPSENSTLHYSDSSDEECTTELDDDDDQSDDSNCGDDGLNVIENSIDNCDETKQISKRLLN